MGRVPTRFDSDRSWDFSVSAEELWHRLASVDDYASWWPWLRRFDPERGMTAGARWECEVAPPLPYVVRFTVRLDRVDEACSVDSTVSGDIRGVARLDLLPTDDGGTRARLVSSLAPAQPVLRAVGRAARPVVEWGHDWVLDQGRRQFVARAFPGT